MQVKCFCIYNNVKTERERETSYWIRQQPYNAGSNYFSQVLQDNSNAIIYKLIVLFVYQSFR
jgi:hypothetical protein